MARGLDLMGPSFLPFVTVISLPLILYFLYYLVLFPLFRCDLRVIPGPLLSKLTDLNRLLLVRTGAAHEHHIRLHQKYGPFVRLGPNNVSIASPAAIPILYNVRAPFLKSEFYPVMGNIKNGAIIPSIFSTRDESFHSIMKRPIAKVYAMTNLRNYEVLVESTEAVFFAKLGNLADQKKAFELSTWFHWFATDVILEITFGKRIGFLEKEEDVEGIIEMVEKRFWYVAVVSRDSPPSQKTIETIFKLYLTHHSIDRPDAVA